VSTGSRRGRLHTDATRALDPWIPCAGQARPGRLRPRPCRQRGQYHAPGTAGDSACVCSSLSALLLQWLRRARSRTGLQLYLSVPFLLLLLLLCGVSFAATPPAEFAEHLIASGLKGGYQVVIADLNKDGKPDVIALASGMSELIWFENPGWKRRVLASELS